MNDLALSDVIRRVMAESFEVSPADIRDNSAMGVTEGWDSGSHVVLVLALEAEFGITFEVHEIETMLTFPDVVELVEAKQI